MIYPRFPFMSEVIVAQSICTIVFLKRICDATLSVCTDVRLRTTQTDLRSVLTPLSWIGGKLIVDSFIVQTLPIRWFFVRADKTSIYTNASDDLLSNFIYFDILIYLKKVHRGKPSGEILKRENPVRNSLFENHQMSQLCPLRSNRPLCIL